MEVLEKCKEIILNKEINKTNRPYMIYTENYKNDLEDLKNSLKSILPREFNVEIMLENEINNYLSNVPTENNIIITNITRKKIDNKYPKFKDIYFLLDYDLLTKNKYFMFPANYESFDFKQIKDEADGKGISKKYDGIMWNNGASVNLGDFVYVYYSNMPDKCNRIMYKCIVIDDGWHFGNNANERCRYIDNDGIVTNKGAVRLKFCEAYKTKEFDTKKLRENGIEYFNKKQPISEDLANMIDNCNQNNTINLKELSERIYDRHCFFENKDKSYAHSTFDLPNGLRYYEAHHLVERNLKDKSNFPFKELIDNDCNLFDLCPTCHRRIHYGKIKDRIKMVKKLYAENQKYIDKFLNIEEHKEFSDYKTNLEWIIKQYIPKQYELKQDDIDL